MLLRDLVATSLLVGETSARLKKIAALSDCLARLEPEEIAIAVSFLSGEIRQGKVGMGHASVRDAALIEPSKSPTLTLQEVDQEFGRISTITGKGSKRGSSDFRVGRNAHEKAHRKEGHKTVCSLFLQL